MPAGEHLDREQLLLIAEGGQAWREAWATYPFEYRLRMRLIAGRRFLAKRARTTRELAIAIGYAAQAKSFGLAMGFATLLFIWGAFGSPLADSDISWRLGFTISWFAGGVGGWFLGKRLSDGRFARERAKHLAVLERAIAEEPAPQRKDAVST